MRDLRSYYLAAMGISEWRLRRSSADYLVFSDAQHSPEKNALLIKMLAALGWPQEKTQLIGIKSAALNTSALFLERIKNYSPKKVLLFGEDLKNLMDDPLIKAHKVPMAVLPALSVLLKEPAAKRQAWKIMQDLIKL